MQAYRVQSELANFAYKLQQVVVKSNGPILWKIESIP